jgi:hypothetical protein
VLGWQFFISRQDNTHCEVPAEEAETVATWKAGLGGAQWIEHLIAGGKGVDLGGNGYPNRYLVTAEALRSLLQAGLPKHDGPPVIGDDYVLPRGWVGNARIDFELLRSINGEEMLLVEAWDQS